MKKILNFWVRISYQILRSFAIGRFILELLIYQIRNNTFRISHQSLFKFYTPNDLNLFRAKTFSTKEPETLEWIDKFVEQSVFWDIGANIGLYSIYAAKIRKCQVFSFEPSVFNLELLAKNIHVNNLVDSITIVPLPLTNQLGINQLNMSNTEWGGALSTFGERYGHDGKEFNKQFVFATIGISVDEAIEKLHIPIPEHIKIDVDGIEHLILSGGKKVLSHVKSVLIEINDDFEEHSKYAREILLSSGLRLKEKNGLGNFSVNLSNSTFNQIWIRE
ncbi:FkbM family methyltransferase [Leptospira levettii]|uniref:FkbM family methyltransferase n=1 Tax=Leptospira levettii TaxID=2023178 RepID=UPI0010831241|nr:FkbM family methyltransferase [Leptospira levettii]TGM94164.1 FkbM family methyltransferase [Leptospira levettii]